MFYRERGFRTLALYDKEGESVAQAKSLQDQGFPADQVLSCGANSRKEADIEDLFTEDDYLRAVNELYRVVLKDAKFSIITAEDLDNCRKSLDGFLRIVPTLEQIWEEHKDQGWGSFDKTKVCAKVFEIAEQDEKYPTEKTLQRFGHCSTLYTSDAMQFTRGSQERRHRRKDDPANWRPLYSLLHKEHESQGGWRTLFPLVRNNHWPILI
jgi:hypothetical protein